MTSVRRERVDIVKFAPTRVACYEHRGPRWHLARSIRNFVQWRQENQLPPRASATFSVEFFPDVPEDEAVTDVYLPLR